MRNIFTGLALFTLTLIWLGLLPACDAAQRRTPQGSTNANGSSDSAKENHLPPLITADELAKLIEAKTEGLKILEPGADRNAFKEGHLPQAQFMHWVADMTDPAESAMYNAPKAKQFSQLMSKLGIKNSDRVVIYDRFSSRLSTRLFWNFKTFGHDQVQVLDGGFAAGKAKLKLSQETVEATPSQYKITATKDSMTADMDRVQKKLADPNARLIDGRPLKQFLGEEPGKVYHTLKPHSRKGRIPGARNVFWKDNFNADGTFKSATELKALYKSADILPSNEVITYCNEGLHAAPPWFVLTQLLDFKDVRLYDSSLAEWAESKQPMETSTPEK